MRHRRPDGCLAYVEFVGEARRVLHRAHGVLREPLSSFVELLREDFFGRSLLADHGRDAALLRLVTQPILPRYDLAVSEATSGLASVGLLGWAAR